MNPHVSQSYSVINPNIDTQTSPDRRPVLTSHPGWVWLYEHETGCCWENCSMQRWKQSEQLTHAVCNKNELRKCAKQNHRIHCTKFQVFFGTHRNWQDCEMSRSCSVLPSPAADGPAPCPAADDYWWHGTSPHSARLSASALGLLAAGIPMGISLACVNLDLQRFASLLL